MGGYVCLFHGGSQNILVIFYISSYGKKSNSVSLLTINYIFLECKLEVWQRPPSPWIMVLAPFQTPLWASHPSSREYWKFIQV